MAEFVENIGPRPATAGLPVPIYTVKQNIDNVANVKFRSKESRKRERVQYTSIFISLTVEIFVKLESLGWSPTLS